jgi:DNA-directed RNA polymerase specialized sigma subunit
MTAHVDDTDLDALAAQVRASPRLSEDEMANLLKAAPALDEQAREKLVGHYLREALAESLERRDRGLDVSDLYQEATVAIVGAVAESLTGTDSIADVNAKVVAAIGAGLDASLKDLADVKKVEEEVVHDTNLLSLVRIRFKNERHAEPTPEELAGLLKWPLARVEVVLDALLKAQATHDLELVEYLDDE